MRTYVITGGTNGMGLALGLLLLRRGDRVLAVARGAQRGRDFLARAREAGAGERAEFLRADLSAVADMDRVVEQVRARADRVDGLVFGAQHFQPSRRETGDGLEATFALAYLSRFVIGHGLAGSLAAADAPVIVNLAGPGGLPGRIHWTDPQLRTDYSGMRAAMQSSRCNDLLGADFPARHPGARTRYVLYNPGFVRTGMADPLPLPQRVLTRALSRLFATSAERAAVPIARFLDEPPTAPLAAFRRGKPVDTGAAEFDPAAADRLHALTVDLLAAARG